MDADEVKIKSIIQPYLKSMVYNIYQKKPKNVVCNILIFL